MDEDISIINRNTRAEKIKNFLVQNKKKLIFALLTTIIILVTIYSFDKYKSNKKREISNIFNSITLNYSENNKDITATKLVEIVNEQDPTYSPLSLYYIIDNKLISDEANINILFDVLINKTSLDKEIKNLVIYKKALFNADLANEGDLLSILNPLINSESVWKSHALYLMAEYFYSKNEKQKAKEFFTKILTLENANQDLKIEAQKRLNRDLSE